MGIQGLRRWTARGLITQAPKKEGTRVMKKLLLTVGLIAVLPLFALPTQAQASTDLNSSMLATCVGTGGNCDLVRFELTVTGASTVTDVNIRSSDTSVWEFDDVTSVYDGAERLASAGGDGSWGASVSSGGDLAVSNADAGADASLPLYITVSMLTYSSGSWTTMTYTADGRLDDDSGDYSTGGTVTPEPLSMILMGTGLAGIAGAARRRREDEV